MDKTLTWVLLLTLGLAFGAWLRLTILESTIARVQAAAAALDEAVQAGRPQ
jgi:hypothetical protein